MSKVKKIAAFTMAMIICATYCLVNSGAVVDWYDYTGSVQQEEFSIGNGSYAEASISNWGYNEEDNDLEAYTRGYNDYAGYGNNILMEVYAEVYITFDDLSSDSDYSTAVGSIYDTMVDASVSGSYLDFWDKCVQDFITTHELYQIVVWDGTAADFDYEVSLYDYEQLGNTICIGTAD